MRGYIASTVMSASQCGGRDETIWIFTMAILCLGITFGAVLDGTMFQQTYVRTPEQACFGSPGDLFIPKCLLSSVFWSSSISAHGKPSPPAPFEQFQGTDSELVGLQTRQWWSAMVLTIASRLFPGSFHDGSWQYACLAKHVLNDRHNDG